MRELRFALLGAGFWSQYQLAGWMEVEGAQCVAICDPSLDKAERLASRAGIAQTFARAEELLNNVELDFVDIVSSVESHVPLAAMAMQHGTAVICQKPLAESLEAAHGLCDLSLELNIPLLVHENWRWQAPLRRLKAILDAGTLGDLVRARIDYANSFPVFDNQPALKSLKQFILADIGTHILDVSRFLFGEADQLYCQTRRMRQDIAGEDVATVVIRKQSGLTVTCNMSYASRWEFDRFPQTMIAIEGTKAGVTLGKDYSLSIFDGAQIHREQVAIPHFEWVNPAYELVHASIVDTHRNLLAGLAGSGSAETTGEDNLKTLQLVYASYESAETNSVVPVLPIRLAKS